MSTLDDVGSVTWYYRNFLVDDTGIVYLNYEKEPGYTWISKIEPSSTQASFSFEFQDGPW